MKLDCIDTFSGIGGITMALADFVNTIQYCEIDQFCQGVLSQRMAEGSLDPAPIHGDIKTLRISPRSKPQMICGGFPCQDISSIGLQRGITNGQRSSMFYHVMRIVDECPTIEVVFLENVANIANCGLKEVITELSKRGFNLQWTMSSAGSFGAPHVRNRWFCLATKPGDAMNLLTSLSFEKQEINQWAVETTEPRVTFKPVICPDASYDPCWSHRAQTLGNAVVPCVVRNAFIELAMASCKWDILTSCFPEDYSVAVGEADYPYPESGLVYNGQMYRLPTRIRPDAPHSVDMTVAFGDKNVTMKHWPTPRRGITHASTLTERSMRDLPTVLLNSVAALEFMKEKLAGDEQFEEVSKNNKLHSIACANVNYIEWMMGYPKDWTKSDFAIAKKTGTLVMEATPSEEGEPASDIIPDEIQAAAPKRQRRTRRSASGGASGERHFNGMHMFMRDNPGKDVRQVAMLWRELDKETKAEYTLKARAASVASNA